MNFTKKNKWTSLIFICILVTIVSFYPTLFNGIVNYDDDSVIFNNPIITNFKVSDLLTIFTSGVGGNYHPLTTISFIINYKLAGNSPFSFHLINLILHLLNTILVFLFIRKLTNNNFKITLVTVLFFCIHPMHVESVAWIVERKDLLFAFFYLLTLLFYLKYLNNKNLKTYILFTVTGILSLLSKPAAVTLPVILVLIDYFLNGKIHLKNFLNKIPLFLSAILIGLATIAIQKEDAIGKINDFSFFTRIGNASYALTSYVIKSIVPSNFSVMHPFPKNSFLDNFKLVSATIFLGLMLFFFFKKWHKNKYIVFGILFFVINLVLVLQFFSVGRAIIAERYTYLPYLGIFFSIGHIWSNAKTSILTKKAINIGLLIFTVYCMFSTWNQSKVWKTSNTLWTKVIKEYPEDWYAYIGRGNYYRDTNNLQLAISDYTKAITLNPNNFKNYFNRGDAYRALKKYKEAITDYNSAIAINPSFANAYINRGQYYYESKDVQNALKDFNTAIKLNNKLEEAYNNRGNLFLSLQRNEEAIEDFNTVISINKKSHLALYNRGIAWLNKKQYHNAINDFKASILLNPHKKETYNNLALSYYQNNEKQKAINTYTKLITLFPKFADGWYNRSILYYQTKNNQKAYYDALKANKLGKKIPKSYLELIKLK